MITLLANEKGGCGKSSICLNLAAMRAIEGRKVLIVDADKQETALFWAAVRDDAGALPKIPATQKTGNLVDDVRALADKFDDIFIDTGGRDSPEVRAGMVVSDVCLIPFRASQFDLWPLEKLQKIYSDAVAFNPALRCVGVFTFVSTHPGVSESVDAEDYVADYDFLKMSGASIRDRIIWRKSAREGLSVPEYKPTDKKAMDELTQLYREVFS